MIPGFDIVGQISGPGGQYILHPNQAPMSAPHSPTHIFRYLGHIAKETGCLVELRGRGSGTVDPYTRVESSESLHLFVEHTEGRQVSAARELCQSLVTTVSSCFTLMYVHTLTDRTFCRFARRGMSFAPNLHRSGKVREQFATLVRIFFSHTSQRMAPRPQQPMAHLSRATLRQRTELQRKQQ